MNLTTFSVDDFISSAVTGRRSSLFGDDLAAHESQLRAAIEGKSVLVIGGENGILVDTTGQRFADETLARSFDLFAALPEGDVYEIELASGKEPKDYDIVPTTELAKKMFAKQLSATGEKVASIELTRESFLRYKGTATLQVGTKKGG